MNKEVKEIVKSINTRKEYVGAPYMTLETKKIDLLLNYINQLEKENKKLKSNQKKALKVLKSDDYFEDDLIISILKGGSDE